MNQRAFVNQNGPSVSRALATAPANEHSASRSRLLRFLCNGFLLADYRITRRSLWAKFTFVTFMTSLTFRTCSTISTLNETKPATVPSVN